jgi:hypothetical protein
MIDTEVAIRTYSYVPTRTYSYVRTHSYPGMKATVKATVHMHSVTVHRCILAVATGTKATGKLTRAHERAMTSPPRMYVRTSRTRHTYSWIVHGCTACSPWYKSYRQTNTGARTSNENALKTRFCIRMTPLMITACSDMSR